MYFSDSDAERKKERVSEWGSQVSVNIAAFCHIMEITQLLSLFLVDARACSNILLEKLFKSFFMFGLITIFYILNNFSHSDLLFQLNNRIIKRSRGKSECREMEKSTMPFGVCILFLHFFSRQWKNWNCDFHSFFSVQRKDTLECLRFLPTRFLLVFTSFVFFIFIAFLSSFRFFPASSTVRARNKLQLGGRKSCK